MTTKPVHKKELEEELKDLNDCLIRKDKEIYELKNQLGINDDEDDSEDEFDDILDSSGMAILKKRQKILRKNIETKKVENYHIQMDIKKTEDQINLKQTQIYEKNQDLKNRLYNEERERVEILREIEKIKIDREEAKHKSGSSSFNKEAQDQK